MTTNPEIKRILRLLTQNKKAAIVEIKSHIRTNGYITGVDKKHNYPVYYDADGGEKCISHYSHIKFNDVGNLEVTLTNGISIPESRLNIKHVEDILCIIELKLANYQQ